MSSFRDNLRSIFGFGAEEEAEERPATRQRGRTPSYVNPFKDEEQEEPVAAVAATSSVDLREAIGDEIVERVARVLEETLPDYAKRCIDKKAQSDYVRGIIGESLQDCIASIYADAEKKAQSRWNDDRAAIEHEHSEAKRRCADLARKNEDMSARMMSVERQKTTLADRVNSLEQRVQTAEAERDQFHMESKGLMNKLKVAQLGAESAQSLQTEVDGLREENNAMKAELLSLKRQAESAEEEKSQFAAVRTEFESVKAECEGLRAEKEGFEARIKALGAEISTLKAAEPRTVTVTDTAEVDRLNKELSARNNDIVEMSKTIQGQNDEIYRLNEKLSQARSEQLDVTALAEVTAERDALNGKAADLRQRLAETEARLQDATRLKTEIEKVCELQKKELDRSKRMYADKEHQLREEIRRLSSDAESLKTTVEVQKQAAKKHDKKKRGTISAIDYGDSDYTEWLMPTPPTPAAPEGDVIDFEFDVPEPVSKAAPSEPVNPHMPTQTSLFGDSDD